MEKTCPQHGSVLTLIWRDRIDFSSWTGAAQELKDPEGRFCPENCGLCSDHKRGSCCVLLEVTKRCNLRCRYCFADAGGDGEASFEELADAVRDIALSLIHI